MNLKTAIEVTAEITKIPARHAATKDELTANNAKIAKKKHHKFLSVCSPVQKAFQSSSASICVHLRAIPDSVAAGHAGPFAPFCGKSRELPMHQPFTAKS
jgi:hypothetical protein